MISFTINSNFTTLVCCLFVVSSRLASAMVTFNTGQLGGTSLSPLSTNDIIENVPTTLYPPTKISKRNTSSLAKSIVFRSTSKQDIPLISDLLAYEVNSRTNSKRGLMNQMNNWNANMQKLKSKASFTAQLQHRMNVINVGSKLRSRIMNRMDESGNPDLNSKQINQLMYTDENFRHVLERAVQTSTDFEDVPETNWDNHNFALQPPSDILNHVMVSAFDPDLYPFDLGGTFDEDALVGFCEIVMLPSPLEKSVDDDSFKPSSMPCITNLVVSPNHRRRGIASKLLRHMIRYAQIHLIRNEEDSVGLYVDKDNHAAVSLYEREGFVTVAECDQVEGRIYMRYQA